MHVMERLDETLRNAKTIRLTPESKFIFFSDCHRGVNDWADDFAHNQTIFFHAIQFYNRQKFTYIEVGDGDELWENKYFSDIRQSHSHVFWELAKFYREDRFLLLYGNHDIIRRDPQVVADELFSYYELRSGIQQSLFPGITVHESLLLKPSDGGKDILVFHGHQADPFNDRHWRTGRFFSRYLWKPLQLLGVPDPTSPAKNFIKANVIEKRITDWTKNNHLITLTGHTHRPHFPEKHKTPYYNDGSCVHPRCITGIEIANGEIVLIKWAVTADESGAMRIQRLELEGPRRLMGG